MSGLVEFAKKELNSLLRDDDGIQDVINKHILEVVEVFSKQGHSGFSANYTINIINRLLRYKPLYPLTGEDDEWTEVSGGMYQNKRCGSVFKDKKSGRTYDINGRIFSDDDGETWYSGKGSDIDITFPYYVPNEPEKVILEKEDKND